MYRAILVDDEPVSLRFLRNYLANYFPGIEVLGAFETGIDALNFLRENPVDLAITDVKMPIMNGVEFAKCARRLDKDMHIVITSGYAEFEFAKGAMQAGVDEYLLKPLNLAQMQATLSAIVRKLDDAYEARRYALLTQLINGRSVHTGDIARYFGGKTCCLALVRVGNLRQSACDCWREPVGVPRDIPRQMFRIDGRDSFEHILVSTAPLGADAAALGNAPGVAATVLLDPEMLPFSRLRDRAAELCVWMDEAVVIGRSQVLEKGKTRPREFARLPQDVLRKLDYGLASCSFEAIRTLCRQCGAQWDSNGIPQRWAEKYLDQIVERLLQQLPSPQAEGMRTLENTRDLCATATSYAELMERFCALLAEAMPRAGNARRMPEELYRQIQAYMRENYSAPLTTQSVSAVTGISQAYLSKLFRRYSDKTFSELLTQYRMRAACQLLMGDTRLQLSEIASMVGYDSQSYFCKVFRQYTGKTPGQYERGKAALPAGEGEDE